LKAKDVIIADAQKAQKIAEAARDKKELEKVAIVASYQAKLDALKVMPATQVVESIKPYVAPGKVLLLANDDVTMDQVAAKFTLTRFIEGERNFSLLTKEQGITKDLTTENGELRKEVGAQKDEIIGLKDFKLSCIDAVNLMEVDRDAWKTTAQRSLRWEKIERYGMAASIVITLLKVFKVF
jgi:hypothetical protein